MILIGGTTILLSGIITTLLVFRLNTIKCNKDKWDIFEWFFAVLFGWLGVIYILLEYSEPLAGRCHKKEKKRKKAKKAKEDKFQNKKYI